MCISSGVTLHLRLDIVCSRAFVPPCIAGCSLWKNKSFQHACGKRCGKRGSSSQWGAGKAPPASQARPPPQNGEAFTRAKPTQKGAPRSGELAAKLAGGALAGRLPPTKKSSPALQSGCFFQQFCLKLDLAKGEIITVVDALGGFGCHRLCIGVTRAVGKLTAGHAGAGARRV